MKRVRDCTNHRFGRLIVLEQFISKGHSTARCVCDCGKSKVTGVCDLLRGYTQSCGCLNKERISQTKRKHGDCASREYRIWRLMKSRCNTDYKHKPENKNWSGRGITVCDRWLNSYENFLQDMGRSPSNKHSIDRIDNDGNYEPGNCRWATAKEQANNTRPRSKGRKYNEGKKITHNGVSKSIKEWAAYLGIRIGLIYSRIYMGWPMDDVFLKGNYQHIRGAKRHDSF